ncbi:heterokaryon incompatibility protein-domain-containing protein [Dichomitus squalens]|uniref:Heterokaryon incompatibility protein-domain-containing protein n=1 Tax=Dichomitus squalens TaxID=114155 RepID=A0A4Q9MNH6_9APHY|nr:heterokaryon incompatibility protein-domain-containing protein [Dichomitus squalens]
MWLLSTDRAELRFFVSPDRVPGGYAILSHVWGENEQSFQDVQGFRTRGAQSGENPRDLVSSKIRECCLLAERHGYRWVWNDTCCIDKTSSAEVSEAINSMYLYYTLAEVCYAYLQDVPSNAAIERPVRVPDKPMILGSKAKLAELVQDITRIPPAVLRKEMELEDFSIARRMSWAAARETTQVEDEAYCLLGIFGINLPTLYGEGRQAFRRLQEEMMRQSIDPSLFAWGLRADYDGLSRALLDGESTDTVHHNHNVREVYLLAASPSDFENSADILFTPPRASGGEGKLVSEVAQEEKPDRPSMQDVGIPSFSVTPYGVHARVPVFEGLGYIVAPLFCSTSDKQTIRLLLSPCTDASDPKRPLDHCAGMFSTEATFTPEWRDVFITHRPPNTTNAALRIPINNTLSTPFRFPKLEIQRILTNRLRFVSLTPTTGPWNGTPPIAFTFKHFRKENWDSQVHTGRTYASIPAIPRVTSPNTLVRLTTFGNGPS